MPPPKSGTKWNITNHFISPLLFFALGLMVASTMNGSFDHDSVTTAPGTQGRLVELMGEVNDLENTVSDLKRQLSEQEIKCDKIEHDLSKTQEELVKAQESQSVSSGEENWEKEVEEEEAYSKAIAGSQQTNVKWNKMGKWQTTEIEPLSFVQKFDIGLPSETIKWSGGQLLVPGSAGGKKGLEDAGSAFDHIENQCSELDVIVLNDQHCVTITTVNGKAAGQNTPYHINRFLKGGYQFKGKNTAKKSSPKDKWELVSRLTSRAGSNEGAPPGSYALKTHRKALNMFLNSIDDVQKQLKPILTKAAKNKVVATMTMNAGMTDMILNFVCSARRAGKNIDHLVLFPTDDEAVEVAKSLGLAYFTHPSFGNFPKEEARSYGDDTFVKMMWIKVLCVFLPVELGFDVLFQDADVVWFKDPISEYFLNPEASGDFDVYFQDDGSRSTRFSPYFANSGFYFLRQNPRTRYFMNMLLYSGDTILEWRSHQSALVQVLADASSKFGLKVKTLSYADFPSGKDYHHRKPYMQQWLKGEVDPYAFHMCWTQNKVDKVKYLKQLGGWFMDRKCNEDSIRSPELRAQGSLADTCCTLEPVIDCFYKDKPSKSSCSSSPSKDKGSGSWWPN